MKALGFLVSVSALAGFSLAVTEALAASKNDLVRCAETTYLSSGMGASCGGDNLTLGTIQVTPAGNVSVLVQGALADPYTLYEVYWLSVGEPVSSAHLLGNFVTDCKGNSVKNPGRPGVALVKPISMAADIATATPTDISTTVGNKSAGVFLVYSRGPYSYDTSVAPPCNPGRLSEYNTTASPNDTGAAKTTTPFANVAVTPGIDTPGADIQFLSGYTH